MHPVKASATVDPLALCQQFQDAGRHRGFRTEVYGTAGGCPLIAQTRRSPGIHPRIYLSAGCHGDEPAGPLALLRLLDRGFFDDRATWFLCPLMNPTGLSRGTRENAQGIDLNRDYKGTLSPEIGRHIRWLQSQPRFDLTLCLHEDWESAGFYVYELNTAGAPSLAEPMIKAVAHACPIELAELIDGRAGKDGIIRPVEDPLLRDRWPEALYLCAHHTHLSYTTESPSSRPLEQRIAAQCLAIETAVRALRF